MTPIKVLYRPGVVRCQYCYAPIGHYFPVGDQVWIHIGGALAYSVHGICEYCRREWHWSYSEKPLDLLLSRRRNFA